MAIENGPVEIVSFPFKMVIFHSFLYVYQRVIWQDTISPWHLGTTTSRYDSPWPYLPGDQGLQAVRYHAANATLRLGAMGETKWWWYVYIYIYLLIYLFIYLYIYKLLGQSLSFLAIFLWRMIREFNPWISLGILGLAMYWGQSWES